MKIYVVLAWLCIGVAFTAKAEPLVTISCEKPEGSSITYGVPLKERLDALAQEQPGPINPTVCTENLNPNVMVMKSAKDRIWRDRSDPLNRAKGGRIFIQ